MHPCCDRRDAEVGQSLSVYSVWAAGAITPEQRLKRVRLRVDGGSIVSLDANVEPDDGDLRYDDATLIPGLIDLQVNGGLGFAFDAEAAKDRRRAVEFHLQHGTTAMLATLISAPMNEMVAATERLRTDVSLEGPIIGIHLEGPFLAARKKGAHSDHALASPTEENVAAVIRAADGGLRMVTLAPELPGADAAIRRFVEQGAVVAAGHSQATSDVLDRAITAGLSFMTHVGNASDWPSRVFDPAMGYRRSEPGMVGTFLLDRRLRGSLILDGHHLDPRLARVLIDTRGADNIVLVSDATPAAGLKPGHYTMGGLDVEIHEAGFATVGEGLGGSTIPLIEAIRVAVRDAEISLVRAVRMATSTPARILGLEYRKGKLLSGWDADFLAIDADLEIKAVFQGGEPVDLPTR